MARSLVQSKRLVALVSDVLPLPLRRRGYAASASSADRSTGPMVGKLKDAAGAGKESSDASSAWVPDPVTGCYRPNNHSSEIDPVELRQMLLNHKFKSSH